MKLHLSVRPLLVLLGLICATLIGSCHRDPLARMAGGWVMITSGDKTTGPGPGSRLLFISGSHYAITQADPVTREVMFHHGGTFKMDGDEWVSTIEYAIGSSMNLVGKNIRVKVKIEDDTMSRLGVDNFREEKWKRLGPE